MVRFGVLAGVALLVAGIVLIVLGRGDTDSPRAAVQGYFADLRDGDAPAALARGSVPSGSRQYLSSTVLRVQQQLAPLRDLRVVSSSAQGTHATVSVQYVLAFAGAAQQVTQTVALHRSDGEWRLDATALPVVINTVDDTTREATVLGNALPQGQVLMFPGAVPVSFSTANLRVQPSSGYVHTSGDPTVGVSAEIAPAAATRAKQAVVRGLDACYGGGDRTIAPTCPLPSLRYVPGSLRGTVSPQGSPEVSVDPSHAGLISLAVPVTFTGSYRKLTFDNRPQKGSDPVSFTVYASAPIGDPTTITWMSS